VRVAGRARLITLVVIVCIVLIALIAIVAVLRYRSLQAMKARTRRKRAPDLEARIKTVLTGPRQKYGDIFTEYSVWKSERETRLELTATPQWARLNEFTRCLVVLYLWRVLESLSGGAVVIIDSPPQEWNVDVDASFRDQGFDWKTFGHGPQFIEE
jgi:hypothetical protein